MMAINVLNEFLVSALIAILLFGVVMNLRYTNRNVYTTYLISMLLFWASVMLYAYIKYNLDGLPQIEYNFSIAGLPVLLMGIPCFISMVCYPLFILNSSLFRFSAWLKLISPVVIVVGVYFGINFLAGLDPFVTYATYGDLFDNITSLSVILRLLLILVFFLYTNTFTYALWKIVPLYNKYVHDNIADSDCNVDWIRDFVKYIYIVSLFYFLFLFTNSVYVNFLYLLSVIALFAFIVDMSLFRKKSEDIEMLRIDWSMERGWHVVEDEETLNAVNSHNLEYMERRIDRWMSETRPYTNIAFTTKDILNEFPVLVNADLIEIFKRKGVSFQIYVRSYRINRACELIRSNDKSIYPKQLFGMVGFSHYSSFSRSFLATMGESPTDYIKRVRE